MSKSEMTGPILDPRERVGLLRKALARHAADIPSTKGMTPAQRAQLLNAELWRRVQAAREALANV